MESKILCYVDQSDSFRTSCKMLSDKNRRSSFSYDLTNERLDWIFFFFFLSFSNVEKTKMKSSHRCNMFSPSACNRFAFKVDKLKTIPRLGPNFDRHFCELHDRCFFFAHNSNFIWSNIFHGRHGVSCSSNSFSIFFFSRNHSVAVRGFHGNDDLMITRWKRLEDSMFLVFYVLYSKQVVACVFIFFSFFFSPLPLLVTVCCNTFVLYHVNTLHLHARWTVLFLFKNILLVFKIVTKVHLHASFLSFSFKLVPTNYIQIEYLFTKD